MKAININPKQWLLAFTIFSLIGTIGCKKSTDNIIDPEYGCDTKIVLETLNSTPGVLVFDSTLYGQWIVSIDLGSSRRFSATFCNKSAYAAKVAGQPASASIPVTVSGQVKRRYLNQIAVSPTTGYVEVYVLTSTAVN